MTDPMDLPPPPPFPLAAAPITDAEPWQRRLEVLALLLVVSVAVVLVAALVAANAQLSDVVSSPFGNGSGGGFDLVEVVRVGGSSANLAAAGALLVALLLVTLGPGDRIGNRGTAVLWGVVVVGLISAGLAAVSSVLTVVDPPDQAEFGQGATGFLGGGIVSRLSGVTPLLVAAVLAGYVAWCAFSTLGDVPADPVTVGAGDRDGSGDAGGDDWAPPPAT